jgi:hypothetical protein
VRECLPGVDHLRCRWHIRQNINKHIRPLLKGQGARWTLFNRQFRQCMDEPSQRIFEEHWKRLMVSYPEAAPYMNREVYSDKMGWASCWTNAFATFGAHSTSRVESVNSVIKMVVNPSFPLKDLFEAITTLSEGQSHKVINAHNNNRFNRALREGPVYGDARLVLTKQAAREVDIEGAYKEMYDLHWLDRKPDLDWQADTMVQEVGTSTVLIGVQPGVHSVVRWEVHSVVDLDVQKIVQCIPVASAHPSLEEMDGDIPNHEGGWLVTMTQMRRGGQSHLPHWVRVGETFASCTNCHFASKYLLPCRHIMAVNLKFWPNAAFQGGQCHPRWLLSTSSTSSSTAAPISSSASLSLASSNSNLEVQDMQDFNSDDDDFADPAAPFEPSHNRNHNDLMAAAAYLSTHSRGYPRSQWNADIALLREMAKSRAQGAPTADAPGGRRRRRSQASSSSPQPVLQSAATAAAVQESHPSTFSLPNPAPLDPPVVRRKGRHSSRATTPSNYQKSTRAADSLPKRRKKTDCGAFPSATQ